MGREEGRVGEKGGRMARTKSHGENGLPTAMGWGRCEEIVRSTR